MLLVGRATGGVLGTLSFSKMRIRTFHRVTSLGQLSPVGVFCGGMSRGVCGKDRTIPVQVFFPDRGDFQRDRRGGRSVRSGGLLLFVRNNN